jgi:uncharacterized protein (DUF697 family)/tellurite resistance protein
MTESEQRAIITVALLATMADGRAAAAEQGALQAALGSASGTEVQDIAKRVEAGEVQVADVARDLTSDDSRRLAYQTALAITNADGPANPAEAAFLDQLRSALGLPAEGGPVPPVQATVTTEPGATLDDLIQKQAIVAAALELLPDTLASIAIIPVQLRLVYQIGQRYGQQFDANQAKDLAATLGIGMGARVMEDVVRKTLGGLAKGIFGGLLGGATGLAAGAAVTFASTYALGHVAKQYYQQGRKISPEDLKALLARFQEEAKALYPKVQEQVQTQAKSLNLQSLLGGLSQPHDHP